MPCKASFEDDMGHEKTKMLANINGHCRVLENVNYFMINPPDV